MTPSATITYRARTSVEDARALSRTTAPPARRKGEPGGTGNGSLPVVGPPPDRGATASASCHITAPAFSARAAAGRRGRRA